MIASLTKRFSHARRVALTLAAASYLSACGGPAPPAEAPSVAAPVYVGSIETVNRESNSVTISPSGEGSPPAAGTDLTAIAASGEATRLKVSADRKRTRLSATVVSGTPKRGQRVYK
jgi:hypothetical protein